MKIINFNNKHWILISVLAIIICSGISYDISNYLKNNSKVSFEEPLTPSAQAEVLYQQSSELYLNGNYAQAKTIFNEIVQKYPSSEQGIKAKDILVDYDEKIDEFPKKVITESPMSDTDIDKKEIISFVNDRKKTLGELKNIKQETDLPTCEHRYTVKTNLFSFLFYIQNGRVVLVYLPSVLYPGELTLIYQQIP